jgi:hypothetical protein
MPISMSESAFSTPNKRSDIMGVRQRINAGYLFSAMLWAAILGAAVNSWAVFAVAAGILAGLGLIGGSVRFAAVRPRRFPRRRSAVRR